MPADVSLVAALTKLHRFGQVNGACLLFSDFIVANLLPFSDKKMNLICGTVTEMCAGYQSAGREITEYYFGYDECQLFVICVDPIRLILLTESGAEPDEIAAAGREFFMENFHQLGRLEISELTQRITLPPLEEKLPVAASNSFESKPAPECSVPEEETESPEEWLDYREKLCRMLARVLGSLQSSRLIDRAVKEHGYRKQVPLKADFHSIAHAVVEKVPNRSTQRALRSLVDELPGHRRP